MKPKKLKTFVLALALGGMPLITMATCDRQTGLFEFFRDDDADFYIDDGYYYEDEYFYYEEEYYYEECHLCF